MRAVRTLIVDDESTLRTVLFRAFDRKGHSVLTASKAEEAKVLIQSEMGVDLAIVDLNLPDGDGIELMTTIKQLHPQCEVLILTGEASIEAAVRATRHGAFQFITKPFNLDELIILADRALAHKQLAQENKQLRSELNKKRQFEQIIGTSDSVRSVLSLVERVAETESTVMVTGESGTGKELIARAIHSNSNRTQNAFVAINCGAIPSELLESELFGHVKGAFTGAIANRIGRFEMADGGTIFLDEIGDLQPSLQVKLLRALQERSFEPVGGAKSIHVNVRVIAATNKNLEDAVANGRFREDLYYRLNVIPIKIPPLRERTTDIPMLLSHFLEKSNKNKTKVITGFTPEAMDCLVRYPWPGNIRELENLIERLAILKGSGHVELIDLPTNFRSTSSGAAFNFMSDFPIDGVDFNTVVDQFENQLIMRALEKTGWNRNQAAALLRLNRTTLVEKIKKKGLRPGEDFEEEVNYRPQREISV